MTKPSNTHTCFLEFLHRCVFCACATLMSRVFCAHSLCIALMFCAAAVMYFCTISSFLYYFIMVAKLWASDAARVAYCVLQFSPASIVLKWWISRMRSQLHVGNQIIVLPLRPAGAIHVDQNFNHMGGNISVQGSSARCGGAVLRRCPLELLGTVPGCLW